MDDVYKHWTGRMVYSEGVRWMAERGSCYWLIDACASWLPSKQLRGEDFIVFRLTVNPDKSAVLIATDGNSDTPLVRQAIEFTDYGEAFAELYAVRSPGQPTVLMQPCEY